MNQDDFQFPCSDSEESYDDVLSVGAARPLPLAAPWGADVLLAMIMCY